MKIPRKFVKLSSSDFIQMIRDEDICEMYLDALVLIDDLLCEFVPTREPPRKNNANSIVRNIKTIQTAITGYQSIQRNIQENLEVAQELRAEALKMRRVGERSHLIEMEIENFLAELLEQYKSVAGAY